MKRLILSLILGVSLFLPSALLASHDGTFSPLSVSQTSVFLNVGQSTNISTFPPNSSAVNIFYISNTSVVSANMNGNTLNLTGLANGTATVRPCTTDLHCADISVTVSGTTNSGSISFSPSSVNVNPNTNTTVTIFNSTGQSLFVSSNSNSFVASVSVSGNTLFINALNSGFTTVTVCAQNSSSCASLSITVNVFQTNPVSVSPNNISLSIGQTNTISVSGGYSSYYISNNSNASAVSAYISGSALNVTAQSLGTSQIMVCAVSASSQCAVATVNVIGGSITLSQSSVSLNINQGATVSISGSGSYYISSNSNPSAVTASISGSTLNLYGSNSGTSTVTVCSNINNNIANNCASVTVSVATSSNLFFITTSLNNAPVNNFYSAQLLVSGNAPFSFFVNSGSLPPGLTLNGNGLISGTPSVAGTYTFTVRLSDASNRTAFQTFTLTTSGSVLGSLIYNNGTLINDNGTIWITYKNTKSGFSSMSAFLGLGYKASSIINGSAVSLTNSGFVVSNSSMAHPWGSWIKSGNTIYFVHENGLIPISHYDIFVANGGSASRLVDANQYDFSRPILPLMNGSDPRLRP